MTKGNSQFCLAQYLNTESKRIFQELASDNYLSNIKEDKALFTQKIAYYQGELIALHPFYELNGRITRLYCDMLALWNGYKPVVLLIMGRILRLLLSVCCMLIVLG